MFRATIAFSVLSVTLTAPVQAQSNTVFLGQIGKTNILRIDQDGNTNVVGGEAGGLRVNQLGLMNTLRIEQLGFGNAVGPDTRENAAASFGFLQTGTMQIGNRNELVIEQSTPLLQLARTLVETIRQVSSDFFMAAEPANRLAIRQASTGGPDGNVQGIGQIIQISTASAAATGAANSMTIEQAGDASALGNRLEAAMQEGTGHAATLFQSGSGGEIGTLRQTGIGNEASLEQADGADNTVLAVEQAGLLNRAKILQKGSRNHLSRIDQNNAGVGVFGNTVALTLLGEDNGGNGTDDFTLGPAAMGVVQASITQIGDGNDLSYAVAAESAANLYGFVQIGNGNGIIGAVSGSGNEAAIRQDGDGNDVRFLQAGAANALAVLADGDLNALDLSQAGQRNELSVRIDGRSNNAPGAVLFDGERLDIAAAFDLARGDIRQAGDLNRFSLAVTGSLNSFAALQDGMGNWIEAAISGSRNQAVVIQTGSANIALFTQTGSDNRLLIRQ